MVTLTARAVLLDMDGTLVDSTAVVERVWTDWAVAHDLDPAHVLSVIHGRQGHESMAILLPERPLEENRIENEVLLARETAETDGVVAIPGATELLAAIAAVPHALVTSATVPLATARMTAAGLGVPALAITAEDVTASKPDPEGFVAAAARLGVRPDECVVFEDSPAGIASGRASGATVIGVGAAAAAFGPDWTVADLAGLRITVEGDDVVFAFDALD